MVFLLSAEEKGHFRETYEAEYGEFRSERSESEKIKSKPRSHRSIDSEQLGGIDDDRRST